MNSNDNRLEVESEQTFVVYHSKSGQIAHVHTVFNHKGATKSRAKGKEQENRALEMAARFGHAAEQMAVMSVDAYDPSKHEVVDPKTGKIGLAKAAKKTAKKR